MLWRYSARLFEYAVRVQDFQSSSKCENYIHRRLKSLNGFAEYTSQERSCRQAHMIGLALNVAS